MDSKSTSSGVSFGSLLFLLFLGLKLMGFIDWSWWWVTAPLWIPIALVGVVGVIVLMLIGARRIMGR